jgi:CheY-like chemotaxis protein
MKILICDDHQFYIKEIIEQLKEDGHDVHYAKNYYEAEQIINSSIPFDVSFLDIILQNGRTGIHLAEKYSSNLGRIMFVTGCTDETTIKARLGQNRLRSRTVLE